MNYAISPERTIPTMLQAMTLDIIPFTEVQNIGQDVYVKDGKVFYRGFQIDDEFKTPEGKMAAAGADITATILGTIPTYMRNNFV